MTSDSFTASQRGSQSKMIFFHFQSKSPNCSHTPSVLFISVQYEPTTHLPVVNYFVLCNLNSSSNEFKFHFILPSNCSSFISFTIFLIYEYSISPLTSSQLSPPDKRSDVQSRCSYSPIFATMSSNHFARKLSQMC